MADPKELALDHFEKVLLALAAGALALVGAGTLSQPAELKATQDLNKDAIAVKNFMSSQKPAEEALGDRASALAGNLDGEKVAKVDPLPSWALYRRPGVLCRYKQKEAQATAKHLPPTDMKGNAEERGKIVLTWAASQGNEFVVVTEYQVQRKEGEGGEWATISTVRGGETRFEDKDLKSRKTYFYRVVSVAEIDRESPTVRRQKLNLEADQAQQPSDQVGPFTTARDVYVIPANVTPVTQEDLIKDKNAKGRAYVYIYKWDAAANEFLKKGQQLTEGDAIGEKGVKMKVGAEKREIDFSTGATLVECREETRAGKFGQQTKVGIIKIKYADGSTEEATTQDAKPTKE
ncbi:MAG: fibronectin type III domain-containing protein [Planctomycetota bacterium]